MNTLRQQELDYEKEHTPFLDVSEKYFMVTGYTEDNMVNDALQLVNLEWQLQDHLKKQDYERVIFYNRVQKLYCYDERSYQLMRSGKTEDSRKKPAKKHTGLKGGPLQARSLRRKSTKTGDSKTEGEGQTAAPGQLHMGKMHDQATFRQIRSCLEDSSIRTAVIFTNADDFLNDYIDSEISDFFARFVGSYVKNKNIVIFIFPESSDAQIKKAHSYNTGLWKELLEPYFDADKNIIRIGLPNQEEIKNLLNYLRLKPGSRFRMNVGQMQEISSTLAKDTIAQHSQLKYIYHCLERFASKGKVLTKDTVYDVLGSKKEKTAMEELDEIIGMDDLKKEIHALKKQMEVQIQEQKDQPKARASRLLPAAKKTSAPNLHMIITGNPGTGKTTVARILGKVYHELGLLAGNGVIEADRQDLVAGYVGQTATKTGEVIQRAMGQVLFIDEAYTLYQEKNGEGNDEFGKEAIETLMKAMEDHRGEFAVIAAGYEREMGIFLKANPGLPRRFPKKIHIADYKPQELNQIFHFMADRDGYKMSEELENSLESFFDNWTDIYRKEPVWGNAGEVRNLLEKIELAWSNSSQPKEKVNQTIYKVLEKGHFPVDCQRYFKPGSRRETALEQLDQLIGFENVKKEIRKLYHMQQTKLSDTSFEEDDVKLHCIITGNPGTGKTTVARILGQVYKEIGLLETGSVMEVKRSDLVAGYVGQTALKTKEVIRKARGGVLFIDEAYELYRGDRGSNFTEDFGREAIEEIMNCMNDFKGELAIIIAGYPDEMDAFLTANPGLPRRFKTRYDLEDYSAEELKQIFEKMSKKTHLWIQEDFSQKLDLFFENFLDTWGNDNKKEIWGNAGEVENLIEDLKKNHADMQGEFICRDGEQYRLILEEHLPEHLRSLALPANREDAFQQLDALVGLAELKDTLREIEASAFYDSEKKAPGHFIFRGNPGTGKTTAARLVGKILKDVGALKRGHLVESTAKELMESTGRLKKLVKRAKNGVLFIDEAHQLAEEYNVRGQQILTELVPILENNRDELCVICAGYPKEMDRFLDYDPGMRSRFPNQVMFEDYNVQELMIILKDMIKNRGIELYADEEFLRRSEMALERMSKNKGKGFGNARDVRNYLDQCIKKQRRRIREKYRNSGHTQAEQEDLKCLTGEDAVEITPE